MHPIYVNNKNMIIVSNHLLHNKEKETLMKEGHSVSSLMHSFQESMSLMFSTSPIYNNVPTLFAEIDKKKRERVAAINESENECTHNKLVILQPTE
jgi:hypothetical protein